jgi:hypothetical protein
VVFNVNELDNRVEMYLSEGLRDAEEWRRHKDVMSARKRMIGGKLLGQARQAAGRAAAAAGHLVGVMQTWIAGSSGPQEECC